MAPKETNAELGNQRAPKAFELEGQFILRLPAPAAELVRIALSGPKDMLKERLKVDMQPDRRDAKVYVDDMELSAKLVDLPCIIESHKTIDRKTFYKTGDISQMLVVSDQLEAGEPVPIEPPSKKSKNDPEKEAEKNKQYQWKHGLTPPLKNVRKTRFRKTLKRKDAELQEIENELKRLLRTDCEAVNVKWEIIEEEERDNQKGMSDGEMETTSEGVSKRSDLRNLGEDDLFGGKISSSEDEDDLHAAANLDMTEENYRASEFI